MKLPSFTQHRFLFLLAVFFAAVFFRLIFMGNYGIGFDQVQILEKATQIGHGHPSLIGPRTGPANMFTGPLIYYLTAPFVLLLNTVQVIALVPTWIALVTGLSLFLLSKKYLGDKEAWILTVIWAFSPFIVNIDRILWNPDLILLSSSLVFFPLLKPKTNRIDLVSLFAGAFLAYQAHFSGLILIGLTLLSVVVLRQSWKRIGAVMLGSILSIVPTVLFDLRNDFLNLRGLIGFATTKGEPQLLLTLKDIFHNFYIIGETLGKVFFFGNTTVLEIAFGLLIIGLGIFFYHQTIWLKLLLGWSILVATLYSFYKGEKPEYYFLILLPVLLVLCAQLLKKVEMKMFTLLAGFFIITSAVMNIHLSSLDSGLTTGNLTQVKKVLLQQQVKDIVYDLPYGSDTGIRYVLADLPKNDSGKIFHVSYPNTLKYYQMTKVADIGIWADPRPNPATFITTQQYFISTNPDYSLLKDIYQQNTLQDFDHYKVLKENQVIGELSVADEAKSKLDWVESCLKQKSLQNPNWMELPDHSYQKYAARFCIRLKMEPVMKDAPKVTGITFF